MKITELLQEQSEDVVDVAEKHGFSERREKIKIGDSTVKVMVLVGNLQMGDTSLFGKYVINPETGSWSFLVGYPLGAMVELHTGEDTSTLIKHLKRKKKVTQHQVDAYIPPLEEK